MIKFIMGIVVGIVLVTYYPQITTTTTKLFIESGARDEIVNKLNEVSND
jgi:hypothetical protein|tara:strand:+ start:1028 stop:1174 length:147 start_codon:yes stop_codon:yes gene_type:complete